MSCSCNSRSDDATPAIVSAFFATIVARDAATAAHCQRVSELSACLALVWGLPAAEVAMIRQAALLHDLGKIGIDDAILRKPGELDALERREMERHPAIGADIISAVLPELLPGIRWHHEHMDGLGYPDALRGDAIPLDARLIAVADAFDAMTADRPYRRGRDPEAACAVLRAGAGVQWDAALVARFIDEVVARPLAQLRAA